MTRERTGRTGSEGARVVGSFARVTRTKEVRGFGSGRLERLAIARRPVSPVTPDDERSKTYGATGNRPSSRRHVPTTIPAARRSAGRGREAHVSDGFGPNARPARPPHELHRDVSAKSENPQGRTSRRQVREIEKRGPEVTKGRSGKRPGGWRLRTIEDASVAGER
jgi:hypothetical protein